MNRTCHKFRLGRCVVNAVTSDHARLAIFERLIRPFILQEEQSSGSVEVVQVVEFDFDIDQAFERGYFSAKGDLPHSPGEAITALFEPPKLEDSLFLWLDAATLVSPGGGLQLLAGPSMAGKTTLTLAMYLAHDLRSLSEDITLIDPLARRIVPFTRPSSLRAGSVELIERATGRKPEPLLFDQWFFEKRMFAEETFDAKFCSAVMLPPIANNASEPLVLEPVSVAEYLRMLLPLSNALRIPQAIEILDEAFRNARCFVMRGGSVEERMQSLLKADQTDPVV